MRTQVCRSRWAALGGLLSIGVTAASATPVKSVRVTSYAEFAEGQAQGVLISSLGDVRPGYSQNRLALPSLTLDSVRALATTADGGVYIGAGGDRPTVLSYRPGAALTSFASLPATTWVTAIQPMSGGRLLVATAQDGRIFRVAPDGKVETVAQLEAEHIWGLARDEARGVTYVATAPGRLWAIDDRDLAVLPVAPGGDASPPRTNTKARKLFESDARQFLALHRGGDGALYVGTADDAVLYRVDPAGGGRAIHDFAGNEVRAIVEHRGSLYVAVNDMQRGDAASKPTPTKITPAPAGSVPGVKAPSPPGAPTSPSPTDKKGKGALYRIEPSGRIEQLHAIVDGFFNALSVDESGTVYAAASTPGGRGRLYGVTPDRVVFTALEVKESDLLNVVPTPAVLDKTGGLLVGTGNAGAFYVVRTQPPADAQYLSKAFAAPAPSSWGRLRYLAEGRVRIETRSGNLAKPDASWSPWQPLLDVTTQNSTGEQVGRIASAAARYLQVRAALPERSVLRDFSFFHQPLNQRPRITEVTVGEDGSGRIARGVRPTSPLRPRSPLVKIRWKTENPDEDDLNYRLYVRPAKPIATSPGGPPAAAKAAPGGDEIEWLRLGGPEALSRTDLEWNTEALADGLYELKVVVSDERSNPPELALTHEYITPPFAIDNRRPEIRDLSWNAATLTLSGRASDTTSPLADISYAIDGGEVLPIAVKDGVLDDLSEEFSVQPPRLSPGSHTLVVRVSDGADNVASAQIIIAVSAAALASRPK